MDVSHLVSRCKQRMAAQNLTNRDVARLADISESTVSRVLSSDGRAASAATIQAICQALEVGDDPPPEPPPDPLLALYDRHLDDLRAQLAVKDRWLRITVLICVCLVAGIFLILLVDLLSPSIGWIRRGSSAGYLANAASGVFHRADCASAAAIAQQRRLVFASAQQAISSGFRACANCIG